MRKFPFMRRGNGEEQGSPERTSPGIQPLQEGDQLAAVIGALSGDRTRLPDRSSILAELNVLTATKGLSGDGREMLADDIIAARVQKAKNTSGLRDTRPPRIK